MEETAIGFWQTPLGIAVISAITSVIVGAIGLLTPPLKHRLDKRFLPFRLTTEYEFDQKKALKNLIGTYHGRLVSAADALGHRMETHYRTHGEGWMDHKGEYDDLGYYFRSFVHRFTRVCAVAGAFVNEAVVIDVRIAEPQDGLFLRYCRTILQTTSDTSLFEDLDYDESHSTDHFFAGYLETLRHTFMVDGAFPDEGTFVYQITANSQSLTDVQSETLTDLLTFFDGLKKGEGRLRWDRLVCLHLLLIAFLADFGYETYRPDPTVADQARSQIENPQVAENFQLLLTGAGFDERQAREIAFGDKSS